MHPSKKTEYRPILYLIVLALCAVLALALSPAAPAANLTAGNETELVAAIEAVNAAGPGDHSITLTADITLTAPLPDFDNATATGITLDGSGHTLDAGGAGTALAVMPGTAATFKDMTITGGAGSRGNNGQSGGGIFNQGQLTVVDATITGNTASHGAGIFNYAGENGTTVLVLTRVSISANEASDTGGGIAGTGDSGSASVTITDSSITGNTAANYGGGISSNSPSGIANLTLENSTVSGNSSAFGAGIFNNGNSGQATLILNAVTVSGNTAENTGGGVFNNGNKGTATVTLSNSTISGNSAKTGGGIANTTNGGTAELAMTFTTIADNSAKTGSGLFNSAGATAEATASILAAGNQGNACAAGGGAFVTSNGYNLDTDNSCGLAGIGDISGGDPVLQSLALNAPGATQTHAIGPESDAQRRVPDGSAGCGDSIATDQRGAPRPFPGALCDIGAYESDAEGEGSPTPTATPTVTATPPTSTPTATPTTTATPSTTPEPGDCQPPYNPASETALNAAIECVNAAGAGTHLITLAADIVLSASATTLNNPAAAELILDGNGHILDGNRKGTVLSVSSGTSVHVRDIILTGGQGESGPSGDWGGGVYNRGSLTIENSTLSGNIAAGGGAIANYGNGAVAELILVRSTLSGNAATGKGGGIYNVATAGGSASLNVVNSTLSGNAAVMGGGLFNESNGGNAGSNLTYSTLALNTGTNGGGGIQTLAGGGNSSVTLAATIITNGAGSGPDCAAPSGVLISTGYNLAGDGTCNLTQGNDLPAADARLQPPALNAPGATATHALGTDSPAINRIHGGAAGCGTVISTDQRGAPRPAPAGGMCDIGAFEKQTVEIAAYMVYLPVGLDH